jgi:hypothetical protein
MKLIYKGVFLLAAGIVISAVISEITPSRVRAAIATLVQNVDEPGRNPYQELAGFGFGSGISCFAGPPPSCLVDIKFPPPPAGKRLVALRISGEIITNTGVAIGESILGGTNNALAFIPVGFQSQSASETLFQFSQELLTYFDAGTRPDYGVFLDGATSGKGQVILSGYLVSVP